MKPQKNLYRVTFEHDPKETVNVVAATLDEGIKKSAEYISTLKVKTQVVAIALIGSIDIE